MTTNNRLSAALTYARRGWQVFPCRPDQKPPMTTHGCNDAAANEDVIRQWWQRWPDANVAVATGARSGVFVLDVDVKNEARGEQSLAKLEAEYGTLPPTLAAVTPSGGHHYFFRVSDTWVGNRTGLEPGLDIRGDGGYVLVAPSTVGGNSYVWIEDAEIAEAPPWLLELLRRRRDSASTLDVEAALHGVAEGARNDTVFRLAAHCRSRSLARAEAEILVLAAAAKCAPPLPKDEALRCVESAYKYPPGGRPLTEFGNAERLVDHFGHNVRFVADLNQWLLWNGQHWEFDDRGSISQTAKAVVRGIRDEANQGEDEERRKKLYELALRSERVNAIKNMITLASTDEKITLTAGQLDSNDWQFGVDNGVVDLKTGAIQNAVREHYITKFGHVRADVNAACPRWEGFLDEVMGGNRDLVEFLQRCVGYSLFGGNPEQVLFVLHGHGANGKSTFVRLLQDLFGGYARAVESSLLMVRRSENANGGPREDIVRLKDARLVLATEIGEGQWLDEERVKRLTGGDTLAGRVPYGRSTIEFQPKFALWLSTNHKPVIHGGDHAIWRRIVLIPFTQTFSDGQKDEMLLTKLRAELPGVLNWAIKGCLAWQERNGLDMPKIVLDATREYRTEMDLIGEWISDACMTGTDRMDTVADLYQSYQQWAEASGLKVLSRQAFGRKLTERGFEQAWPKGQRGYRGIEVKPVVHDFQTLAAA